MGRHFVAALVVAGTCLGPLTAVAQSLQLQPRGGRGQGPVVLTQRGLAPIESLDASDARRDREELEQLLNEHPPNVRTVLQADPSLLQRDEYLASYPRLGAFLKEHPEVARDPTFFFGTIDSWRYFEREQTPQERAIGQLQEVLAGTAMVIVVMTLIIVIGSLVRQAFSHRRWVKQSRVQTDVHTKILDRLQSNEELLAYIQTPAGQRFLEVGPSPRREVEPRTIGAPYGRILWSLQAGIMLMALGIGLWFVQRNAMVEIAPAFGAMGTVAVVLGVGGIVSAGLAYALSSRLGLLNQVKD
jgi:hypothetical protein